MKGGNIIFEKTSGNVVCILKKFLTYEASFKTREFKLHKLETGPSSKVTITKQDATHYYKQMVTIRRLEAAAGTFFKQKLIGGFCHLQTGQEACAVGMKAVMRSMDSVIAGYRVHGWAYLMGLSISEIFAELLGKQSGSSKGKGGSMHIYGKNFYGGNGIVGAQVPLGTGIALAKQYLKTGGVCFTIYGDGAAKQGQVFEAFNIAKLWRLPCIFVCENNGQALSLSNSTTTTPGTSSLKIDDFYTLGDYIPGIWVDGTDVLSVKAASKFAINHCITVQEPILLELSTPGENENILTDLNNIDGANALKISQDPLLSFKESILLADLVTERELKEIDEEVIKEMDKSALKAMMDSQTILHELTSDVYAYCLEDKIRHIQPHNH